MMTLEIADNDGNNIDLPIISNALISAIPQFFWQCIENACDQAIARWGKALMPETISRKGEHGKIITLSKHQ